MNQLAMMDRFFDTMIGSIERSYYHFGVSPRVLGLRVSLGDV